MIDVHCHFFTWKRTFLKNSIHYSTTKNTWESAPPPTAVTSELWGAPMSKARGPPPGLSSKGATNASNGWGAGLGSVSRSSSSWGLQSSTVGNTGWMSTWLLLKNLTPQIDGSTLKTLCMQHGPVQDFRLYQNHGIALTKYSSRDEAIKVTEYIATFLKFLLVLIFIY